MIKTFTIHFFLFIFLCGVKAQDKSVAGKLNSYMQAVAPNKVYLQTDRPYYYLGDKIHFKAYVVSATTLTPVLNESMLYVELYNESGGLEKKQVFKIKNGVAKGQVNLEDDFPSGYFTIVAYTNWMKNQEQTAFFRKKFHVIHPSEINDNIRVNYHVVHLEDGDSLIVSVNQDAEGENVNDRMYVDFNMTLKDGSEMSSTLTMHKEHKGNSRFFIPTKLIPDTPTVKAKFERGAAVFNRVIPIIGENAAPDMKFLPEGGNLINGIHTKIAFKGLDQKGNPIDVRGAVVDGAGNELVTFNTQHNGMGLFGFTPLSNQNYSVQILTNQGDHFTYKLPKVEEKGVALQVDNIGDEAELAIKVQTNDEAQNLIVLGYAAEKVFFEQEVALDSTAEIHIPKSILPNGASRILVLNQANLPVAERMVFKKPSESVKVSFDELSSAYTPRGKVDFSMSFDDMLGKHSLAQMALSVTDYKATDKYQNNENIASYLLLNSEIKGAVEGPAWYFENDSKERAQMLDLVMLTHGWSRYDVAAILKDKVDALEYERDSLFYIRGQIRKAITRIPIKDYLMITTMTNKGQSTSGSIITDSKGHFYFNLTDFYTRYDFRMEIANKNQKYKDVLLDIETPYLKRKLDLFKMNSDIMVDMKPGGLVPDQELSGIVNLSNTKFYTLNDIELNSLGRPKVGERTDSYYSFGGDTIALSEVEVYADRATNVRAQMVQRFGAPQVVVEAAAIRKMAANSKGYTSVWDILEMEVPGLKIVYDDTRSGGYSMNDNQSSITLRDVITVIVDGRADMPSSWLMYLDPKDIEAIELVDYKGDVDMFDLGARAPLSSFGHNSKILLITTKTGLGFGASNSAGRYASTINGFRPYQQIYLPDYSDEETMEQVDLDQRKTVYWDPELNLPLEGTHNFSFYLSDYVNPLKIQLEGITKDGRPFYASKVVNKAALNNVNAKPKIKVNDTDILAFTNSSSFNDEVENYTLKVIDDVNKKPISFAHVFVNNGSRVYLSNDDGEFELNKKSKFKNVSVFYPGYLKRSIDLSDLTKDSILVTMSRAEILPLGPKDPVKGKSLMREVIKQSNKLASTDSQKTAFYREKIYRDGWLWGLKEYVLRFSAKSTNLASDEDRVRFIRERSFVSFDYREKMHLGINNTSTNYPFYADAVNSRKEFLMPNTNTNPMYEYKLVGKQELYGRMCYVVDFDMASWVALPFHAGRLWIDVNDKVVLHMKYSVSPKGKEFTSYATFVKVNNHNDNITPLSTLYEASYFEQDGTYHLRAARENLYFSVNYEYTLEFNKLLLVNSVNSSPKGAVQIVAVDKLKRKTFLINEPVYSNEFWRRYISVKGEKDIRNEIKYLHEETLRY